MCQVLEELKQALSHQTFQVILDKECYHSKKLCQCMACSDQPQCFLLTRVVLSARNMSQTPGKTEGNPRAATSS